MPVDHLMMLRPDDAVAEGGPVTEDADRIRLRIVGPDFEPLPNITYSVIRGNIVLEHKTDDDGFIDELVPVTEDKVFVQYEGGESELKLASLPPVGDIEGGRVRLTNLGYAPGTGSDLDPAMVEALLQFRSDKGLPEPEDAANPFDKKVQDALVEAHRS